jgi:hypothetical protein
VGIRARAPGRVVALRVVGDQRRQAERTECDLRLERPPEPAPQRARALRKRAAERGLAGPLDVWQNHRMRHVLPGWRALARRVVVLVALVVGPLAAGCGPIALPSRALKLHYTIEVASDAGSGATVTVAAGKGVPADLRVLLPPNGPRRELVPLERAPGEAPSGPNAAPARVAYHVLAPDAPHGGPGFACYRGFELFAQPAGVDLTARDSIVLDFRLAETQNVVAPLAALAADPYAPTRGPLTISGEEFVTLLRSYIAIGDYGVRVLPAVPGKLPAIVWGRRRLGAASEAELVDVVERLLLAHAQAFGPDRPGTPYSVIVDHPYEGYGFAGNATGRSIDLRLSRDQSLTTNPGLLRLTAHELSHFWLGGAFPFPKPEDHWFVEGAADYYGLRARVTAGFLSEAEAGDELADAWRSLAGNRWLKERIEDLGTAYERDPEAFTASYARGCTAAWALDWRARLLGRPPLAELLASRARGVGHPAMRELVIAHLRGANVEHGGGVPAPEDPGPGVEALLGQDPGPEFLRVLDAAGLHLASHASNELTFGLERFEPGTTRLLAVTEGSPAGAAGVRPGDRIREVDGLPVDDTVRLQEAMEHSYARPAYKLEGMEVTYERAGVDARVRLFAAPSVVPLLTDASGVRAGRVLP